MSDQDLIRSVKRSSRVTPLAYRGDEVEGGEYKSVPLGVNGPHAPMKRESEAIRRAMAETGRTEEDLRQDPHYRKLFSEAAKAKGTKTPRERKIREMLKAVLREVKLPKEHPKTLETLAEMYRAKRGPFRAWGWSSATTITLDELVSYLKHSY